MFLLPSGIAILTLAWVVHGYLLEAMSQEFVTSRLKDEAAFLEHQVRQVQGDIQQLQTGSYFEDVFHHAFAVSAADIVLISPDRWRPVLAPLINAEQEGIIRVDESVVEDMGPDFLAYRKVFLVNGTLVTVLVSEDLSTLHTSQESLHLWTAGVLLVLVVLLVGVTLIGVHLSLRPVPQIMKALSALREGEISRIHLRAPVEFQPLVAKINLLIDSLDQRLAQSRNALANLSHSIKTPITAIRQVLEDTDRPMNEEIRLQMVDRLQDLDRQLESEIRRGRFAGPQVGKSAYPVKQARDLLWMLGRLHSEKQFELKTDLTHETRWPIEEHDLNEILGNLLDNAGKWASSVAELALQQDSTRLLIEIRDDGPGVAEEALSQLGQRGVRLDEQAPGHGIGLSIAKEIVERYGGQVSFSSGIGTGLTVRVIFNNLL